ncbi:IS21 family transposase [Actinomadura sp. 7K507]|uniref:IS21 family transposase n=1 Tax=Actinomadura sp. 7K507 TaxID=2530365 RepID=UPI00104C9D8D|nr:IS21 family transposase [Actinomadura sp. 7K507]TDC94560.1 IS21 family transposase [Actinomadura sp. 7K507]
MIKVEDWAEIRRLHRSEGMPIKAIARRLGISKNTVKRALAADEPPVYRRMSKGSIVDAAEPQIRELLAEFPDMPATVIAERIGWERSMTVLKDRVRQLRPQYRPADPASRTAYQPGELAQCDLWFPPAKVPVGAGQQASPPVLVMVSGYSRWMLARMLPSRAAGDLFAGMWALLRMLDAAPRSLVWDNEGAIGQWRGGRPVLTAEASAFRGTLGIKIVQCRPADPEAKGLVERANEYLETSFMPGRSFTGPDDFNAQLDGWLAHRANVRHHRRLGCRPADRIVADMAAMVALPPVAPVVGWRTSTRLARDHYVRIASNDYSVHPSAIGRLVEVVADPEQVRVTCGGQPVATHPRCWAVHQTITDPAHAQAAAAMRQIRLHRARPPADTEVEQRRLADYDTLLGIDNSSVQSIGDRDIEGVA